MESRNIYLYWRKCVKFNTWFRAGHCASIMSIREHNYNKHIRSPEYLHPNNIENHIIRWTTLHILSCSTTATAFSGRSFQTCVISALSRLSQDIERKRSRNHGITDYLKTVYPHTSYVMGKLDRNVPLPNSIIGKVNSGVYFDENRWYWSDLAIGIACRVMV